MLTTTIMNLTFRMANDPSWAKISSDLATIQIQ